ncbi:MAG: MBL fold metallo-hydrolase [Deltaproteobacteria bacterium]|nr:MBL fold metallo-hydrolase [Deltaproteobacteria bacterium]
MKNLSLWRSITISFVLCPLVFSPLGAEVYYRGDWVKITDRVYHFQRKQSSNSGAIIMKDYVVIVDAGQEPGSGKEVVDKLSTITDKPVKYVVITHYHDDHIMSIPWFKKQGAVVIAHDESNRIIREMGTKLIDQRINIFGKNRPELKQILKDAVIDVADVTSVQPINYDYPNIKQWTTAMQSAMELEPALYLAGHGTPIKTDTVKEIVEYYSDLRKGIQAYIDKGVPLEKIQAEFQLPKYKDWPNYKDRFKTHIMVMYKELTGETKKFYDIK